MTSIFVFLSDPNIYLKQLSILYFKFVHNNLPITIVSTLKNGLVFPTHLYDTRTGRAPRIPQLRTELGRQSIIYQIAKILISFLNFPKVKLFTHLKQLSILNYPCTISIS